MLHRSRPISRRLERAHQVECDRSRERVGCRMPTSPSNGLDNVAAPGGGAGQRVERPQMILCTPSMLGVDPTLEIHAIAKTGTVQQRTCVKLHGLLPPLGVDCVVECPDVRADDS